MLAQPHRKLARAADLQRAHAIEPVVEFLERGEFPQQRGRRLRADAGDAGDVIDGVAHQCLVIRHPLRPHAELALDVLVGEASLARVIPVVVAVAHQLGEVLVARDQHRTMTGGAQAHGERADDVVRLVRGAAELGEAEQPAQLAAQRELALELGRRRFAVLLVGRIDRIPERGRQRLVEGDRDVLGPRLLQQVAEESPEPV